MRLGRKEEIFTSIIVTRGLNNHMMIDMTLDTTNPNRKNIYLFLTIMGGA
jgi:hypothetical protein